MWPAALHSSVVPWTARSWDDRCSQLPTRMIRRQPPAAPCSRLRPLDGTVPPPTDLRTLPFAFMCVHLRFVSGKAVPRRQPQMNANERRCSAAIRTRAREREQRGCSATGDRRRTRLMAPRSVPPLPSIAASVPSPTDLRTLLFAFICVHLRFVSGKAVPRRQPQMNANERRCSAAIRTRAREREQPGLQRDRGPSSDEAHGAPLRAAVAIDRCERSFADRSADASICVHLRSFAVCIWKGRAQEATANERK